MSKERASWFSKHKLLIIYDLLIFTVVWVCMMIVVQKLHLSPGFKTFYEFGLSLVCLFVSRFCFRIHRQVWRYGGVQCYLYLLFADGFSFVANYVLERLLPFTNHIRFTTMLSTACIVCLACLGIRMVYRYAFKSFHRNDLVGKCCRIMLRIFADPSITKRDDSGHLARNAAIFGAGHVGVALSDELLSNTGISIRPCCFVDTDGSKVGKIIHGIPVYHENEATVEFLQANGIHEIVFAVPNMDVEHRQKLYNYYKNNFVVKVYDFPTFEAVGKRQIRDYSIEELLFRNPSNVLDDATRAYYGGKTVLITGGGGSIGSELCRQIASMSPKKLIILDIYENCAYEIQQELKMTYADKLDLSAEIISVCDRPAMERVFAAYRPDIVIHAAAHKHVPFMEHNVCEAISNNVFGTLVTLETCEKFGVKRFMMVSTDKAVNPTNVMGATKRMCEMLTLNRGNKEMLCSATRFGNVLGSAGSVVPLFKKQISRGGPVTLTDKRITRYFMTIPEASQLVLVSGALAKKNELFVLDMGKPVKIYDLARNMIELSGLKPDADIKIVETGLRPGEKLYEELLIKSETLDKTENNQIFIERDQPIDNEELQNKIRVLSVAVASQDNDKAREVLHSVVPTYRTPEEVNGCT